MSNANISVRFEHGLGDCVNFARMLPVYQHYGIDIKVQVSDDKKFLFPTDNLTDKAEHNHGWWIPSEPLNLEPGSPHGWSGNKPGVNLRNFELGKRASMEELWARYKSTRATIELPRSRSIESIIETWPRPIVLWHSIGNTSQEKKSFTPNQQLNFAYCILEKTNGTLIVLDWDSRVTWTHHNRYRHSQQLGHLDLQSLAALINIADLFIGIDSGPFYFSSLFNIPSVGIYFDAMHPSEYMVPWPDALSITMGDRSSKIDPSKRFEFQLIDLQNGNMDIISDWCTQMLEPRRYLSSHNTIAQDVQLQHIIQRKCRGHDHGGISKFYDRNRSFDILFCELLSRGITSPRIVETGCIRSDEDWAGAGMSTALFGRYSSLTKGKLISFDLDPTNVRYAQQWCRQFGDAVEVTCCRGNEGIQNRLEPIDVLYLDSADTGTEKYQEINLKEFEAAEPHLHSKSLVLIDDTPGQEIGKGALTVPYAISKGWKIIYSGYQVLLGR